MIKKTYQTARLQLVLSDASLAEQVAEYYQRNIDFFRNAEPRREKNFYSEEFQRRALARELRNARSLSSVKYWMHLREEGEGTIIGMVALSNIVFGAFQSAYVSYNLDTGHTGQGYMQEAVQKLIEIAFEDIGLHRLEANIMPSNGPSLRLAERLGFENEGLAKQYLHINGKWEDHVHMVLLNPED